MASRRRWAGTIALAATVSTGGLFVVAVGAPMIGIPREPGAMAANAAAIDSTTTTTTSAPTTTTAPTAATTTIAPTTAPTTIAPTTIAPTATSTTVTTPLAPPATTTAATDGVSVGDASVVASGSIVGLGGTVTFDGTCPVAIDSAPAAVVVRITNEASGAVEVVDTGTTASPWSYTWTAPNDARDAASFVFRFWCDVPSTGDGSPIDRYLRVDMVASAAPTPSPPLGPVGPVLPETE